MINPFYSFGNVESELWKRFKRFNVLVIGNTGVGKSTLIGSVLDISVNECITKNITPYKNKNRYENGFTLTLYDTPGLEKDQKQRQKVKTEINQLIGKNQQKEPQHHIHAIWYCITSQTTRNSDIDIKWIKEISDKNKLPIVIVITRSLTQKKNDFHLSLQKQLKYINNSNDVILVLATSEKTDQGLIPSHGLDILKNSTEKLIYTAMEAAINNAVHCQTNKAYAWSRHYYGEIFVSSLMPIPLVKNIGYTFIQTRMLKHISDIYIAFLGLMRYSLLLEMSNRSASVSLAVDFGVSERDARTPKTDTTNLGLLYVPHQHEKCYNYRISDKLIKDIRDIAIPCLGIDIAIESILEQIPIGNTATLKDIGDYLINISEQIDNIPILDNIIDFISSLDTLEFLGELSFIKTLKTVVLIFTTILIASAYIETLKDSKIKEYKGELTSNMIEEFKQKLQNMLTSLKEALYFSKSVNV